MDGSPMMSPKEAASVIGCSTRAVTKWLGEGELPGTKVGRNWYVNRARLYERLGLTDEMNKKEANIQ